MRCDIHLDTRERLSVRWHCPLCSHTQSVPGADLQFVCFIAVHHLANRHAMTAEEILLQDAVLKQGVEECFGTVVFGTNHRP